MHHHTDKSPVVLRNANSNMTISPNRTIPITHKVINRVMLPIYVQNVEKQPDLQKELEIWINRYRELEALYQGNKGNSVIIVQYQEKIELLTQENYQMAQLLEQRITEVQQWEHVYSELQLSHAQNVQEMQKSFQIQIASLSQELQSYKNRYQQLEVQMQTFETHRQQESQLLLQNVDQQRQQSENEVIRLRQQLDIKMKEIENYKQQKHQLEQTIIETGSSNQNYESKLLLLTQEIENCNLAFQKKGSQFEQIKKRNSDLEQEIQQLRQQYDQLAQQTDFFKSQFEVETKNKQERDRGVSEDLKRIQSQISERDRRITQLEQQLQQYHQLESQYIQLEDKCTIYQQEIERLNNSIRQKESQILLVQQNCETIQQKLLKSENTVIKIQTEYQQIHFKSEQTDQLLKIKQQLEERVVLLGGEIERLNGILKQLMNEIEQSNSRTKRTTYEYESLISESQKYHVLVEQQQREIEEWRRKYSQIELLRSQAEQLRSDNDRLNELLKHMQNENEQWRYNYTKLEEQLQQDYEQKIIMLSQEIERLSLLINDRSTEQETNKRKITILEEELRIKRGNQDEKLVMLTSEIERLNLLNLSYSEQIEMLKNKLQQLEGSEILSLREKNMILNQEIERLQRIVDDLTNELEIYRLKYADQFGVGSKYEELLLYIAMYKAEIESLRMQVTEKEKEMNDMRKSQLAQYRR